MMNANVDRETCTGCKLCANTCGEVFKMSNGKATIVADHIPCGLKTVCEEITRDCPNSAIHLGEASGLMLVGRKEHNLSWIAL